MTIDVIKEEKDYLAVYKSGNVKTVPLKSQDDEESLLFLLSQRYPEILSVNGKNSWEGGVIHRLDTATSGLVLVARNDSFYKKIIEEQKKGCFIKRYVAKLSESSETEGFESFPYTLRKGEIISSYFRAYGKGRKAVRPVLIKKNRDTDVLYETEILSLAGDEIRVEIKRGFRHQIRSHLAWSGRAIAGDALYGGDACDHLHLCCSEISFLGETISLP